MTTHGDILHRQDELQVEANAVALDLRLDELLGTVGDPVRVGSAALGLMVRRDLDITVVCRTLDAAATAAVGQIGAHLALHESVWQVQLRNDTGRWNTDPAYPDGLYLGLRYRPPGGDDWNLDIWFVDQPERQPDLAHLTSMPARLTPAARTSILQIKRSIADSQQAGGKVRSYLVYTAVLDYGVQTPEQFTSWLTRPPTP
jgi:hypothetical protein